jgi:hypothetical protein
LIVAWTAFAGLLGCDGAREGTFRGRYVHAFEASAFTECGRSESWWATFQAQHPSLDSAIANENLEGQTEVFLVVHGRLSDEGSYGHLGASTRELTVDAVHTVAVWNPDSCR